MVFLAGTGLIICRTYLMLFLILLLLASILLAVVIPPAYAASLELEDGD
jgi:hypothetical protein